MEYTTLECEGIESQEAVFKKLPSLYAICQQVVDGRQARGKRYELGALVLLLVLANWQA